MTDTEKSAASLLSFTIDTNTAKLVKVESRDANGASHELSESEKVTLAKQIGEDSVGEMLEEAFEAGIACVLGNADRHGKARDGKARESAEDAELRHLLLAPLIAATSAKRLLQPEVLHRAILETLVHDSIKQTGAAGENRPAGGLSTEGGTPSRTN